MPFHQTQYPSPISVISMAWPNYQKTIWLSDTLGNIYNASTKIFSVTGTTTPWTLLVSASTNVGQVNVILPLETDVASNILYASAGGYLVLYNPALAQ